MVSTLSNLLTILIAAIAAAGSGRFLFTSVHKHTPNNSLQQLIHQCPGPWGSRISNAEIRAYAAWAGIPIGRRGLSCAPKTIQLKTHNHNDVYTVICRPRAHMIHICIIPILLSKDHHEILSLLLGSSTGVRPGALSTGMQAAQ